MYYKCFYLFPESIEEEQANIKNIHRNLDHIRLDIEKLNKFIDAETKKKENLANEMRTTTSAFQKSLKVSIFLFVFVLSFK